MENTVFNSVFKKRNFFHITIFKLNTKVNSNIFIRKINYFLTFDIAKQIFANVSMCTKYCKCLHVNIYVSSQTELEKGAFFLYVFPAGKKKQSSFKSIILSTCVVAHW